MKERDKNEIEKTLDEVREKIAYLRQKGISKEMINILFDPKYDKVSRMYINKDFRIFLTDYDNLEIHMTPLVKTVYFLFLNHPEGIVMKNLASYYDELLAIYSKITNRSDVAVIEKSIRCICNPTDNSINEKCAVIRRTFNIYLDTTYAEHYIIIGERGLPKSISLDRTLVSWDNPLMKMFNLK